MSVNRREQQVYEEVFREHVHSVVLKRWSYNYHCGIWEKHKPDALGRSYSIYLNKTRGIDCGKVTLFHELVHIRDDVAGITRTNGDTECKARTFCQHNYRFVNSFWNRFIDWK